MMQAAGGMGGQGGGIISSALQLIKEKERQGDKAMDRLHDGMKTQMELTANQGSWTDGGSSAPQKVVKEKVVEKEKVKEPEKEKVKEPEKEEATTDTPTAPGADKEEQEKDVANLGIIDLAKQATSK